MRAQLQAFVLSFRTLSDVPVRTSDKGRRIPLSESDEARAPAAGWSVSETLIACMVQAVKAPPGRAAKLSKEKRTKR